MKQERRIGQAPSSGALFHRSERNKLIIMSVLLVLVIVLFVGSLMQTRKYEGQADVDLPDEGPFTEEILLPEFDRALVEGRVSDSDADGRVLLEPEPYDAMFRFVQEYGQVYFEAGELSELDAGARAALEADPAAHRAQRYRVRGYLEELKTRERPDGLEEHRGWVRTEDGQIVHFRLGALEEKLIRDDFARVDGLFLKLHQAEGEGGWEEGPLLVGAQAVRSYPLPEELGPETIRARLALVEDDTLDEFTRLQGDAFDANWILMTRALDADSAFDPEKGTISWDEATELDNRMLGELRKPGGADAFRGRPFRIPISRNMDARTRDPGENPARIDRITEGWIGNQTWTVNPAMITYHMPRGAAELRGADFVQGRGYFLKNLAYEPRDGGRNLVPYFVIASLEPFVPPKDDSLELVLYAVAGITVLLVVLIPVLLLRDRRRSEQLQRELTRRRQERRQRSAQASRASS